MSIRALSFLLGALFVSFIWLCFSTMMPVGSIDGKMIYKYEVKKYQNATLSNSVKNYAKDKIFYKAMNELGVNVSDEIVEAEFVVYAEKYGGEAEMKSLLLDTMQDINSVKNSIKKSLLYQKAVEHFTEEAIPAAEEAKLYYSEHMGNYHNGFEADYDKLISDLKAEIGLREYQNYMEAVENDISIKVY